MYLWRGVLGLISLALMTLWVMKWLILETQIFNGMEEDFKPLPPGALPGYKNSLLIMTSSIMINLQYWVFMCKTVGLARNSRWWENMQQKVKNTRLCIDFWIKSRNKEPPVKFRNKAHNKQYQSKRSMRKFAFNGEFHKIVNTPGLDKITQQNGTSRMTTAYDTDSTNWVVDVGSTDHVCNKKELFKKEEINPIYGVALNGVGGKTPAKGIGKVEINLEDDDGQTTKMELKDVLYVPECPMNLFIPQTWAEQQNEELPSRLQDTCSVHTFARKTFLIWGDPDKDQHIKSVSHPPGINVPIMVLNSGTKEWSKFGSLFGMAIDDGTPAFKQFFQKEPKYK